MKIQFNRVGLAISGAVLLMTAGCGGGSGDIAVPATTPVSTTVVDGAIRNALVCLDKNGNGLCDVGEVQGRTDVNGKVTIDVPSADVGKFPIIALVGLDAVDKDHGPVTTAYAMAAPADQSGVVSPLTTLVQQTVALTGATSADAAKAVQATTGITASLFEDFTKTGPATGGGVDPGTVARLIVVTTQKQSALLRSSVGTPSLDGATITQSHIDTAVRKKLLELLPDLVAALADPAVMAATDRTAKEALLLAAATTLATNSGLNTASVATAVAVNTQGSTPAPVAAVAEAPSAGFSLAALNFTSATNYFIRVLTSSAAQNTADTDKNVKYVERRVRNVAGNIAQWGPGSEPARGADLHFNGTSWVNCPVNFENTNSVRDAAGNSTYNYCDGLETGKTKRIALDVASKPISAVYAQLRAAGYADLNLGEVAVLGTGTSAATFPAGSSVHYQVNTPLTEALAYYPGSSNWIAQYSAAVSAGGNATTQATTASCNSAEFKAAPGVGSATLETLIGSMTGTPCVFPQGSFTLPNSAVRYTSPDEIDEVWSNSTLAIGSIGTAPVGSGTAPGFYTGNTKLRIAFKGDGVKAVTYYACKERFNNGSTRNCTVIGQGSYTITAMGDGRVLTLNGAPALIATQPTWALVERGGHVYRGYQNKPLMTNTARLNATAATALLSQLGLPAIDPSTPFGLTTGSYQGIWDVSDPAVSGSKTILSIMANGDMTCKDSMDLTSGSHCAATFTDPVSGAFQFSGSDRTASGAFNYLAGTASGDWRNATSSGHFVAQRR